jgi:hypothetical protein
MLHLLPARPVLRQRLPSGQALRAIPEAVAAKAPRTLKRLGL